MPAPEDGPLAARLAQLHPHSSGWVPDQPPEADDTQPPSLSMLAKSAIESRSPLWARGVVNRCSLRSLLVSALVLVVVAVGAVTVLVHHHGAPAYGTEAGAGPTAGDDGSAASADAGAADAGAADPGADDTSAPDTSADDVAGGSIVVDVGGRVRRPGLVTLPAGARVADALAAAGGPLHPRDVARLDLASKVSDGQLLLIGPGAASDATSDDNGQPSGGSGQTSATVDLNTATSDQLDTLPGVGPVTAQKIIDWRSAHNGFSTVSQLQQVPGIGPARYAELQPLVTVS